MGLKYIYPFWGSGHMNPSDFISFVIENHFNGIEINPPSDGVLEKLWLETLEKTRQKDAQFICVAQQVSGIKSETPDQYLIRVSERLITLLDYQPNFINSHTGKDHFTFDENCRIIDFMEEFSIKNNIPVFHEIHRGRFTFHSQGTLAYLNKFPSLKLVGDLSHWCVVSESMLRDQQHIISEVIPHINHIHARVGFEQAPQVNNPFAPEWSGHLNTYLNWWRDIIYFHKEKKSFTVTPEVGPYPYMPEHPFTRKPISDQKELNIKMKEYLQNNLK